MARTAKPGVLVSERNSGRTSNIPLTRSKAISLRKNGETCSSAAFKFAGALAVMVYM